MDRILWSSDEKRLWRSYPPEEREDWYGNWKVPDLEPGPHVRGTILDAASNEPLADVRLQLVNTRGYSPGPTRRSTWKVFATTTSDSSGKYEFESSVPTEPSRQWFLLVAKQPGFTALCRRQIRATNAVHDYSFEMIPGVPVRGRVLVGEDDRPAASGLVETSQLFHGAKPIHGTFNVPHFLGPEGQFELWLPPGPVTLTALVPECISVDASIRNPSDLSGGIVLRVKKGNRLVGRVTDTEGTAIVGASISIGTTVAARTDEDGGFDITGLPSEVKWVRVRHWDYLTEQCGTLQIPGPPLEVQLTEASRIGIDVLMGDGDRPNFYNMQLEFPDGTKVYVIAKDMVPTAGHYSSQPFPIHHRKGILHIDGYSDVPIEWEPRAGKIDLGLLTLHRGNQVNVRVLDADGNPIPVEIMLKSSDSNDPRKITRIKQEIRFPGPGCGSMKFIVDRR